MSDDDKLDPATLPNDLRGMAGECDRRADASRTPAYRFEEQESAETLRAAADRIAELEAQAEKLQRFKSWVHGFLDARGVPHHPPGVHGAEGCRVGDRMDWLVAQLADADRGADEAIADRDRLEEALAETHRALGGDGEWVAKLPPEPPPHSGDLAADVPELARSLTAELADADERAAANGARAAEQTERLTDSFTRELVLLSLLKPFADAYAAAVGEFPHTDRLPGNVTLKLLAPVGAFRAAHRAVNPPEEPTT